MTKQLITFVLSCSVMLSSSTLWSAEEVDNNFARWEKAIAAFESEDEANPPNKGQVLFVGSSSTRLWNLSESFPDIAAINRGFGGSEVADTLHFADRIVLPYEPRTIVLYAGDNDISRGKSAETVHADFLKLVAKVHETLPKTRIVFVAIKPSIKRWALVGEMRKTNSLIRESTKKDSRMTFVDIDTPMIGDDGKPRPELFVKDGLHLSKAGYAVWNALVKPHLAP